MTTPAQLQEQVNCAKRELAYRESLYPRWVKAGRMKEAVANHETRAMRGIVETLEKCLWLAEASDEMRANERKRHAEAS